MKMREARGEFQNLLASYSKFGDKLGVALLTFFTYIS